MKDVRERVALLQEFLSSVGEVSLTELDANFNLVSTDAKYEEIYNVFFTIEAKGLTDAMYDEFRAKAREREEVRYPTILSSYLNIFWMVEVWKIPGSSPSIFMLGPVFLDELSRQTITAKIHRMSLSVALQKKFLSVIYTIPVVSLQRFYDFGIMLHRALYRETISIEDFLFVNPADQYSLDEKLDIEAQRLYDLEQSILRFVREGNLSNKDELNKLVKIGRTVKSGGAGYLRQAKNTAITFAVLCCAAAIEGGLACGTAYYLREYYVGRLEDAPALLDVTRINNEMLADFIRRVHQSKLSEGISPKIKECCDYIDLHIEEKLRPGELAALCGDSEAYFSTLFKREVGVRLSEFIADKKVERACSLLVNTSMGIPEIADRLGYASQSYFGDVFRKIKGVSPGEFRKSGK